MTTRTWNGSNGSYNDASAWSPNGIPVAGDTAIINAGTVTLPNAITGVAIQLNEASGATAATTLALNNATLDGSSTLTVTNSQTSVTSIAPVISVSGTSTLAGTESFYGSAISFSIGAGSTLNNVGTLNFYSSSPTTTGGGTLANNGVIALVNPSNRVTVPVLSDAITGTGTIALGKYANIQINGSVSSGQTLIFNDGASGNETAQFNAVGSFGGTINGFSSSDLLAVVLPSSYTNATYTSTGSSSGTLSLYNNGSLLGNLNFLGNYSLSSFTINPVPLSGGQTNVQITTSVVNAQSSGLPAGYQNGGNGSTTVGAVYRFFDKNTGTHFFTASSGERDVTKTLSNYVQETNDFGDVPQSDPNSEAVYRFFDTKFGTHFFTASASERDTVIATRSDLTYEPGSTFYEHATQQSGDVAVYRFFDTKFGTHFYTGDAGEAASTAALKIAGTNQAAYTAEGIGFYAPAGSFV